MEYIVKTLKIFTLCILVSCGENPLGIDIRPSAEFLTHYPKDAPQQYITPWVAGCETGMSYMTNELYYAAYEYKVDVKMMADPYYAKVWRDARNYCRHRVYGLLKESDLRLRLSNQRGYDLEHFNVDRTLNAGAGSLITW